MTAVTGRPRSPTQPSAELCRFGCVPFRAFTFARPLSGLSETIKIGVRVGVSRQRAHQYVGRDQRIGGSVATVSERDPAVRHVGNLSDDRQACGGFAEGARPGVSEPRVEFRQQPPQLLAQCACLKGQKGIALSFVRNVLILAPANDAAVVGCADIKIRLAGFPDGAFARPQTAATLRHGGDRPKSN